MLVPFLLSTSAVSQEVGDLLWHVPGCHSLSSLGGVGGRSLCAFHWEDTPHPEPVFLSGVFNRPDMVRKHLFPNGAQ